MPGGQFSHYRDKPRPGHGTPWVNSGMIPAILGQLASLMAARPVTEDNGDELPCEESLT